MEKEFLKAYNDFADAIFRYCYFRVGDREAAKDIMQETFTKTWQYIVIKEGEVENIRAFLYKIATNLIIDRSRKKKPVSLDELESQGFEPSYEGKEDIYKQIEGREIMDKLKLLDDKDSEIIIMRFIDDLPVKEIAEIINETENNTSVKIHRVLKKLKQIIEK